MSVSNTLTQSVQHWTIVLKTLARQLPAVTVEAHQKLELDDDFFDAHEVLDGKWFQLDGKNYDLFLDDGVGTIHLANLSGRVNYVNDDARLVTWYGHDPKRYDIHLTTPDGTRSATTPTQEIVWFAWRTDSWTLYAHDGKALVPVFNTVELIDALGLDSDASVWLAWNGSVVDLFTVPPGQIPNDVCATFVGHNQSIGALHVRVRRP